MELHKDSGSLRVIIDVSYTSADEFIDFIENEQCQFIESLGVDGLKKFEWYVDEETNTATLIEEFDKAESFKEVATKAGKNKILVANITGITPALFTFNGMYVLCPPITFLPLTLFANCIGILL